MADIFVSYTSSDKDWAFWIGKELEALGHTPHIHEWEIKAGGDIYAWMEQRHDAADHVLCLVSDDYLKAPYSTLERNAALWQAAAQRPGFVLLVAVKLCKLPTLSDHIRRCELFGVPEDAARVRFREFMSQCEAPETAAFPGKVVAVSNIPIRVPEHFLGRDDSLAAIETSLARYEGRVAITTVHGLRGVGKTTLAAAYAEKHRGDYRATWWIRAQTGSTMRADLVALGVRLGWVGAEDKEEPALAAVMERLRHEGEGILLIYDNAIDADSLKPYLARGGAAKVLVTSNAHAWRGVAEPVEIRLWPKQIGADYLIARTGRETERAAAEVLSDALGGLPLAHEQAAAYCEHLEVRFAEYQRRFEAAPVRLLDDVRHAPAEHNDGMTVAKSFALAIEEAAKLHPAAEPLIVHAALLAPEPIPLFLFAEAREKFGEPLASALEGDALDEAVAVLRTFALLDRETIADERDPAITTGCIRLHRLVREIAAARRGCEERDGLRRSLAGALVAACPDGLPEMTLWPRFALLTPHLLTSCEMEMADAAANPECFEPLDRVIFTNFLGAMLGKSALGRARARLLYERALAIGEKVLGSDHPEIAGYLRNLATLLKAQGDLAGARPLCERALVIKEKTLGPEHPEIVWYLSFLASLLQVQGEFAGARPLYERALAIHEKALSPEYPDIEWCLSNLASLLQAQGDFAGARPLRERALAILEKALGPDSPSTNLARGNFARLLLDAGNPDEALAIGQTALAAHEKALGQDDPWTKNSAGITAAILDALGRSGEAVALRARYGLEPDAPPAV